MELDVKKETEKLQAEMEQLTKQLQQIIDQMTRLQGSRQELMKEILKKSGALEHLQGLK